MFRAHAGLKTMDSEEQQTLRWWDFPPPSSQQPLGGGEQKRKRMVIPSFPTFDPCLNRTLCLNESQAKILSFTLGKSWVGAQS